MSCAATLSWWAPRQICIPMWREVVDADIAHLRKQRHRSDPLPVSSVLRDHAIRLNDTELNDESGFPAILEFLHAR